MSWRMARSLDTLLNEVNRAAPNRNKATDGGIGDAAHASRSSDHNPWVKDRAGIGVVRARDFTHDPPRFSADALANHVAAMLGKHPALGSGAYVIWNHRIISTSRLSEGWRRYPGANAHTKHVHVSVGTSGYDTTQGWNWPPTEKDWFDMATKKELKELLAAEREAIAQEVWKYTIPATDGAPAQKVLRQASNSLAVSKKVREIVRKRFNATDDQLDALMTEIAALDEEA